MMEDQSGQPESLGRYQITGVAGEGAMAVVYKALDPEIGRTVAVKVLKKELGLDDEYLSRFLREARAAGTLSHPNIVTIHDVGKTDDAPYITMEYLEGETLEDVMAKGKSLGLEEILRLGIDIASALDYAHARGVVHRDIKPGNIIFTPGRSSAKIADFGIARVDESEEAGKTQAGLVVGTPRYMSPEQAQGLDSDGRSDLFSVGVMLYELVTGQKAFQASSMTSLLLQITQEDPQPIRKIKSDVPVGMRRIIRRLMQKNPERRFQSGAELQKALRRELDALLERKRDEHRDKFIPLKVRWALSMGAMVAVVLIISMFTVFRIQSSSIIDQSVDAGSSLAKFIATEAAIPVLSEDWIRLETFVAEASARNTFEYLVVVDHTGIVRAATDVSMVDQTFAPFEDAEHVSTVDQINVTTLERGDGPHVFNFDAPILFQNMEIGRIELGVSRAGFDNVMSTTRWLMVLLGFVTVTSVVGMLYVFGGLLARPINMIKDFMDVLGQGDFSQRISLERNDEIGELFTAYNQMADSLHDLYGEVEAATPSGEEEREPAGGMVPPLEVPEGDADATVVVNPGGRTHDDAATGARPDTGEFVVDDDADADLADATIIAPAPRKAGEDEDKKS